MGCRPNSQHLAKEYPGLKTHLALQGTENPLGTAHESNKRITVSQARLYEHSARQNPGSGLEKIRRRKTLYCSGLVKSFLDYTTESFHQGKNHVGPALAHGFGRLIFGRMIPFLCSIVGWKLEDYKPFDCPITFQRFGSTASDDEFSSVSSYCVRS